MSDTSGLRSLRKFSSWHNCAESSFVFYYFHLCRIIPETGGWRWIWRDLFVKLNRKIMSDKIAKCGFWIAKRTPDCYRRAWRGEGEEGGYRCSVVMFVLCCLKGGMYFRKAELNVCLEVKHTSWRKRPVLHRFFLWNVVLYSNCAIGRRSTWKALDNAVLCEVLGALFCSVYMFQYLFWITFHLMFEHLMFYGSSTGLSSGLDSFRTPDEGTFETSVNQLRTFEHKNICSKGKREFVRAIKSRVDEEGSERKALQEPLVSITIFLWHLKLLCLIVWHSVPPRREERPYRRWDGEDNVKD